MYQYKAIKVNGKKMDEHRYIAKKFFGEEMCRGKIVHHKNGNKKDNRIENLEIMPLAEHTRKHQTGRRKSEEEKRKTASRVRKYFATHTLDSCKPVAAINDEGEMVAVYESTYATESYGFTRGHVSDCCEGKRKTHGRLRWCYLSNEEVDEAKKKVPFLKRLTKDN